MYERIEDSTELKTIYSTAKLGARRASVRKFLPAIKQLYLSSPNQKSLPLTLRTKPRVSHSSDFTIFYPTLKSGHQAILRIAW